jgi:hypothetical protein
MVHWYIGGKHENELNKKWRVKLWAGFIWLRIESSNGGF